MKAIIVSEVELQALLDKLELRKLKGPTHHQTTQPAMDEAHRMFHYEVVSWMRSVGGR